MNYQLDNNIVSYPRVLVINHFAFNTYEGGQITLTNLFSGWPKENLAIFHTDPRGSNIDVTNNIFRLKRELWLPVINKTFEWQTQLDFHFADTPVTVEEKPKRMSVKRSIARNLFNLLGIAPLLERYAFTDELKKFITSYKPQLVYTQLGNIAFSSFVTDITGEFNIPYVVHIMDDYPSALYKKGILSIFTRKILKKKLINVFRHSKKCLGISQAMCDEYAERYGVPFIPFHNPVDLSIWSKHSNRSLEIQENKVKILYSGRIGIAAKTSIKDLIDIVQNWRHSYLAIDFEIYVPDVEEAIRSASFLKTVGKNVKVLQVPPDIGNLAKIISDADILLMPVDFDQQSIDYIRLSMPTKLPVYVASGRPILVYGPSEVATVNYAKKANWGLVVEKNILCLLSDAIIRLSTDKELRERLSRTAKEIASQSYNKDVVQEAFRQILSHASTR